MSEPENQSKESSDKIYKNEKKKSDFEELPNELEELPPQVRKVVEATLSM